MSRLRANQITNENANGAPNFPHGLTVTGVVTATTAPQTMSSIVVGSAVTANSQGIDVTGIVTATSFSGSGANLTSLPAGNLTGTLPAISGANLTGITAGLFSGVALLQDQKSQGTHGGQPPNTSSYFERDLNTEVFDTGNFVSLSSNNFTLIAGTYLLQASIPAHRTNNSKALLYNITDGTTVAYSQVVYIRDAAVQGGHINLTCRFTIGSTKSFDIRQRVSNSDGEGLGHASGYDTEIYTQVLIFKEN